MNDADLDEACRALLITFTQFGRLRINDAHAQKGAFGPHKGGLKHSEFGLLFALRELEEENKGNISVTFLSRHLNVRPPTIAPTLASLEQKGMVRREIDPDDRRIIRVTLTESGRTFFMERALVFMEYVRGLVEYLGKEESFELSRLLGKAYEYELKKKTQPQNNKPT